MSTIQQPDSEQQPGEKSRVVMFAFRVPRVLKVRMQVLAAQKQRTVAAVCIDALTQYADRNGNGPTVREMAEQIRSQKASSSSATE